MSDNQLVKPFAISSILLYVTVVVWSGSGADWSLQEEASEHCHHFGRKSCTVQRTLFT